MYSTVLLTPCKCFQVFQFKHVRGTYVFRKQVLDYCEFYSYLMMSRMLESMYWEALKEQNVTSCVLQRIYNPIVKVVQLNSSFCPFPLISCINAPHPFLVTSDRASLWSHIPPYALSLLMLTLHKVSGFFSSIISQKDPCHFSFTAIQSTILH